MRYLLGIYIGGRLHKKIYLDEFPGFFEGVPITIGRRETNDICIPQNTVSRQHAVIRYNKGSVEMTDSGSLNKLSVKGKIYDKIKLVNDMQILIGTGVNDPESVILLFVDKGANQPEIGKPEENKADVKPVEKKAVKKEPAPIRAAASRKPDRSGTTARRLFACMADCVICLFMLIGLCGIIALIFGIRGKIKIFMVLAVFLCLWLYFALAESGTNGGTMGKNIFGIMVVDRNGKEITFAKATIRLAAKLLSVITLFLPVFGNGRCLHDVIAGTYVVRKKD